jgi:hypothetical protein
MAKQPDDLVLRILKEIRQTLADHGRTLHEHGRRFDQVDRQLDEIHRGMVTALGPLDQCPCAPRHNPKRLKRLEEKV